MNKNRQKISAAVFIAILLGGCSVLNSEEDSSNENHAAETVSESLVESESSSQPIEEKRISFVGVGDNLIHSGIFKDAQKEDGSYDFKPIYQLVAEDIQAADISYINQETILGGDDWGFSGYPAFNTPSAMADDLADLGFNLVNGASNHSLDIGTRGVLNSLETFAAHEDIIYTGMFNSSEQQESIPVFERDGVTFSLVAYTYGTNGVVPEYPYLVNYFDEEQITRDVERAKEISDVVLVSAHWGDEHTFAPNEFQQSYAQLFADLEVDVVIGTHPHTIQPIEWVEGKGGNETLVIYSLGNFIAASKSEKNLLGGMVSFEFVEEETGDIMVENVAWESLVIHYENTVPTDIETRSQFAVHKLGEYTEELAGKHGLNGYDGNQISIEEYQQLTEEVIDEEFLNLEND